jgi:hypothetical protein
VPPEIDPRPVHPALDGVAVEIGLLGAAFGQDGERGAQRCLHSLGIGEQGLRQMREGVAAFFAEQGQARLGWDG